MECNVEGANHLGVPLCSTKHAKNLHQMQVLKFIKIAFIIQGICVHNGGINPIYKRENKNNSNVISVPKVFEDEVSHQILGQIC